MCRSATCRPAVHATRGRLRAHASACQLASLRGSAGAASLRPARFPGARGLCFENPMRFHFALCATRPGVRDPSGACRPGRAFTPGRARCWAWRLPCSATWTMQCDGSRHPASTGHEAATARGMPCMKRGVSGACEACSLAACWRLVASWRSHGHGSGGAGVLGVVSAAFPAVSLPVAPAHIL